MQYCFSHTTDISVCQISTFIEKNCDRFPKLVHGKITYYNDAAIAKAYCDPDFTLIGSRYMYCDLAGWNDTFPACQGILISNLLIKH